MAYAERRAANPGALGLTIGLNMMAVLALAAWNPSVIRFITGGITTIEIPPVDSPPPPPIEKQKQQQKQRIDRPDTKVDTGASADPWIIRDPDPGPIIITGPDTGPITFPPDPPPVHKVVKRGATMTTSPDDLQPPYPPNLQREGKQGSVAVRVFVGLDGRPRDIVMVRTDDPDFFTAAKIWGLRHWRFKPASEDGVPVEAWFNLTVRFTIN